MYIKTAINSKLWQEIGSDFPKIPKIIYQNHDPTLSKKMTFPDGNRFVK